MLFAKRLESIMHSETTFSTQITLFFREAKENRDVPKAMNAEDYATLCYIFNIAGSLDAISLVKFLLGIAYRGECWENLTKQRISQLLLKAIKNVTDFGSQEIANTLWALATAGVTWADLDETVKDSLLKAVVKNARDFNSQAIANTLWALATAGATWSELSITHPALLNAINRNTTQFTASQCIQLGWSAAWFHVRLNNTIYSGFKKALTQPSSSALHSRVSELLKQIPCEKFNNEYLIGGLMYVDICFPTRKLVIEVDGPSHTKEKDRLKEQLLSKFGYKLEHVVYNQDLGAQVRDIAFKHKLALPLARSISQFKQPSTAIKPTTLTSPLSIIEKELDVHQKYLAQCNKLLLLNASGFLEPSSFTDLSNLFTQIASAKLQTTYTIPIKQMEQEERGNLINALITQEEKIIQCYKALQNPFRLLMQASHPSLAVPTSAASFSPVKTLTP